MMKLNLPDHVLGSFARIFSGFPIQKVYIFGSRARGTHSSVSDIDVAVFAPSMDHVQMNVLRDALDEIDTILRIDVVHVEHADNPVLIEYIEREGIQLYP